MKVLIVCRKKNIVSPFITEQVDAISNEGVDVQYFYIEGKGKFSYLLSISKYFEKIKSFKPDIIHAHYGLSGLFANMQRKIPVITTFHGSDINLKTTRIFSLLTAKLSMYSIFVSEQLLKSSGVDKNYLVQACGVDFQNFYPIKRDEAREKLNLKINQTYVLFAGAFDNEVKNATLAKSAIAKTEKQINLIELKDYTRTEVNLLFNACDLALMTSVSEGSPQFIKEAMACNCPVVSTGVGDVQQIIGNTYACYVCIPNPDIIAEKINKVLELNGKRTEGRKSIMHLNNKAIATNIISLYKLVLNENQK